MLLYLLLHNFTFTITNFTFTFTFAFTINSSLYYVPFEHVIYVKIYVKYTRYIIRKNIMSVIIDFSVIIKF